MAEKIQAVMIFEILGKPPEYINETLSGIIEKMGGEKGVSITSKKIHEPKPVENSEVFTSFAEVEAEVEGLQRLMTILFAYMPAHIEILAPSELRLKNFDFCASCNDILAKLHNYDGVAKTMLYERNNLLNQLNQLKQIVHPHVEAIIPEEKISKSKKSTKKKKR
ncbi:MAG: hypothetical protein KKB21_01345 [Nanoarchaeota archaeon]|nr:hypothetical protein [Nanoarchaeota archaeon]MBU4086201.1 hypothetical protein [Nanoarchaeota archaeon]